MALTKRNYVSGETVITAKNLNEIQDAIITLENNGGITPSIGDNGNWYIGSTDTGKPSRGEKGDPGAAGAPGKDGAGMDITGATVGQIAKITAVDDTGKPTAWEAVDMPRGSGGIGKQSLIPYGSRTSLAQRLTILRRVSSPAQKANSIILS